MQRRSIRLSEGLAVAFLLLVGVSLTVFLAFVLAVNDAPMLVDNSEDELILATDTPFWVAGSGVVMTATPSPTPDTDLPTLAATAVAITQTPVDLDDVTSVPTPENCGVIPPGWQSYVVRPGDTVMSLAVQSGGTAAEIMRVNCLTTPVVYPSTVLYLPGQAPTRIPCGPPSWWTRYLVQSGDTLYSLALRTGTTVYQIMNANCMVGTRLTAGRYIYLPQLPAQPTPLPSATPLPSPTPTEPPVEPTATNPPEPTATAVIPTATATMPPASATPEPTATVTNTPFPTATLTPQPTVEPTRTATPTLIPSPTSEPATPTATATPAPPTPTATFSPTPEPPTETPVPPTETATSEPPTETPPPPTDTPTP